MNKTLFLNLILAVFFFNFCCKAQSDIQVSNGAIIGPINFPGILCSYQWTNDNTNIGLASGGTGTIASFIAKNTTNSPIVATVTATPAISGMAYITNNYANTISIIDLSSNTVIKTLNVGNSPITAVVNPINNQVYVGNSGSGSVSVINTSDNTVKTTISVGSYPFGVYVSRDDSRAFVANLNDNNISVINTTTNTVIGKFSAPNPSFMTSSTDDKYLYVVNYDFSYNVPGLVTVLDAKTGANITTLTVGTQPWDVNTSPDGKFAYVTNQGGSSISVINTSTNTITATIPTEYAPRHVIFSPDGSLFYVRAGYNNTLSVYSTTDFSVKATIQLIDHGSAGLSISPDGKRILATNQLQSTVTVIDASTNTIVANIQTPGDESLGWGNIIMGGNNCSSTTFKITVNPSPNITINGNLSALSTTYGSNSATTSFTLSATWLTSAPTLSAPAGFEISKDGITFSKTLTIDQSSGKASATIYVRLSAKTAVNKYSGDITISSNATSDIKVPIPESEVKPALLTIKADDKTKFFGTDNPVLTASYTGFVNNETLSDLAQLPSISTTAVITSPIGNYPIVAINAQAINYTFNYLAGVMFVVENTGVLSIPNTFTPNNDGVNDTWVIKNITSYPENTVTVFNRYGQQVFFSKGYSLPWDGRYLNKNIPDGVYFYVIKTGIKGGEFSGSITIVR
ncbi:gliding motility-associated C-terminal domain-containing protein [Mucilaginibacter ximonensis]|uniref:Gliding motility-associated C-terminal domain-containing protein n=1 Tax=Mucilaginibacter ximonensis TaxID=538021 RepID=A0ABW5YBP5_9SPHI